MISFGFMTLDLQNEHSYFTEIARRAQKHRIHCFRFIPSNMNPMTEMIEGEEFDINHDCWEKKNFHLPEILYDRCFYGDDFHSRQCKAIVTWLKGKENVQFLGIGLPNKLELYEALSKSKLSAYIPNTIRIRSAEMVNVYLKKYNQVILKPIDGSQGYGIYLIEQAEKQRIVKTDKIKNQVSRTFSKQSTWLSWLERILSKNEYMLQPFLALQNENKQPFDIRSLLQKDRNGRWVTVGKGIRQGRTEGIVSNLSLGGTVIPFDSWLSSMNKAERKFIVEEIEDILQSLPVILERTFSPLFELGVDIGIAKDHSIWILDINSKPGRKVLLWNEPEMKEYLFESPLLYARLLQERSDFTHEETISD